MTGCLSVNLQRVGGGIEASANRVGGGIDVTAVPQQYTLQTNCSRVGGDLMVTATAQRHPLQVESQRRGGQMNVTFGIVCGTNYGFEILYAKDGKLITINGKYLMVKRRR